MAKISTLVGKDSAKLSDREKATSKADKAILAMLKSGDAATLATFGERVATVLAVFSQSGDGAGKRFSGAADHSFDANVAAYAETVIRGNIPKIG